MTNGEKLKEIFPNIEARLDAKTGIMIIKWTNDTTKCFKASWWNAEYKEPTDKIDCDNADCNNCVNHKYCDYEPNKSEIPTGSDCVSREKVWFMITGGKYLDEDDEQFIDRLVNKLAELPPVTLIRPKGHWIKEKSIHGWDGHSYQCSVCGRSIHLDTAVESLVDYPYCHCGSKNMR